MDSQLQYNVYQTLIGSMEQLKKSIWILDACHNIKKSLTFSNCPAFDH